MRNKIIEAAVQVFSESGYHKSSVDDIAKRAGVAKGSIYYHFQDKAVLFTSVVEDSIDWIVSKLDTYVKDDMNEKDVVRQIVKLMVQVYGEYPSLCLIIMERIGFEAEVAEKVETAKDKLYAKLAEIILLGQNYNGIRKCNAQSAAAAYLMFIFTYCRLSATTSEKDLIVQEISEIIIYGLWK